ncbi:MAG: type I 3-dehydroquinate dehydratase [Patescibacteria group bacterium]|jgi:3-dehydroquinate dehydratase-1
MTIKYCLPIIKSTQAEVLATIQANLSDYTYFEVWLDYITDLDDSFVPQLIKQLGKKLILVLRRQKLARVRLDADQHLRIIQQVRNTPAWLDLDISDQTDELELIKNHHWSVQQIVSYHNYHNTPHLEKLWEIIDVMHRYAPKIYKISTLCLHKKNALTLLQLLLELKAKKFPVIVLGMGEWGTVTRIYGSLWGNEMIFAPLTKAEQSAPGQLTKAQLQTMFTQLS